MTPVIAPRPAVPAIRALHRSTVRTYIHRDSGAAWLDVGGPLSPPFNRRSLLHQLRRAHRRLPDGVDRVGLDLTRLDEFSIELAVVLSLESRMLDVRDIQLTVAVRNSVEFSPGAQVMIERLKIWRLDDADLAEVVQAAAAARLGTNGWGPVLGRALRPRGSGALTSATPE